MAVVATGEDDADAPAASLPFGIGRRARAAHPRGEGPDVTFTALDDLGVEVVVLVGGPPPWAKSR